MLDLLKDALTTGSPAQVAIALVILFAALLLVYLLVRKRQAAEIERLHAEGAEARRQLAIVTEERNALLRSNAGNGSATRVPGAPPPRWSGTEVAAVLAAVTALLTGLGGLYISSQKSQLEEANRKQSVLNGELKEANATLEAATQAALPFTMQKWMQVSDSAAKQFPKSGRFAVDGAKVDGCPPHDLTLTYAAAKPAIVNVPEGSCTLHLSLGAATRVTLTQRN